MDRKILLNEVNQILDNIDEAARNRNLTADIGVEKPQENELTSSWALRLLEKLRVFADRYRYAENPTLSLPVKELEQGDIVSNKLIEIARQIHKDVSNNITCTNCTSNCTVENTMGTNNAIHNMTQGVAQCNGVKEGTSGI